MEVPDNMSCKTLIGVVLIRHCRLKRILLSLFLGFGKRRCEIAMIANAEDIKGHRRTLDRYTPELLMHLLSTSGGATWVSFHHGGGVGMGYSQHAGLVICCDGTDAASERIKRVLWNDPATGVMRHADAGYEEAKACAREHSLNLGAIDLD